MNLEDLKKLCDEATPGPWISEDAPFGGVSFRFPCEKKRGDGWHHVEIDSCDGRAGHNCDFIAAAREALPKLIAVAEAAKSLRDNYGGEARDRDLDAIDDTLAALETK